ncbi:glycosyltransferase family 2 protein [Vibrio vulnificus]|uniref:glycosyltransferase n=1 Tax=Vibrio vulnificus TaxID=672 RepID=UPI0009B67AD1|nr:glycosyltransferase family 2 protein [Vibrio vulnificus]EGR7968611.1 glycosyltransferase family 2 protein [Vibrio vulnificus]EID4391651.1 glycosyltransferase family 2 protein [Vibrio vulnificus]EJQ9994148.1 glycosyltransferase family 2 protein [Vibrio vulnificus]EKA7352312.1 glycosyltransferase family 2 protein [Vibrio vulnificus]ELM6648962.1 glycosyltransferase family 2 protein [Vibrio vulnificus]
MQKVIVGIVSHGHYGYISNNEDLTTIAKLANVEVVVKDNIGDDKLREYCNKHNFTYIISQSPLGFGDNNNSIFEYAKTNLNAKDNDWFIIFNPDVEIKEHDFKLLMAELGKGSSDFYAPNLFKDSKFSVPENSIRYFATYKDLFNPFFLKPINRPYNKAELKDLQVVDWASGAFLCIKFSAFAKVGGFDSKYFMYYEDVDLCYRLKQQNEPLRFLKGIKAVHKGEYKNRSVFSKHFRWYLNSLFKFLETQRMS